MGKEEDELWDLWYGKAASTGISFARGRIAAGVTSMLVHAAPEFLTITIYNIEGRRLAAGEDLQMTTDSPMCRVMREGHRITRQDLWPSAADLGSLVILPGGEVGTLNAWWHAEDHSEWRWQVEFYNHH